MSKRKRDLGCEVWEMAYRDFSGVSYVPSGKPTTHAMTTDVSRRRDAAYLTHFSRTQTDCGERMLDARVACKGFDTGPRSE